MDPLSDVLRAVRLTGSVFLSGHFTAPWCIGVEITPDECARHLPGRPAQIIGYHVVVEGRMHVGVDSEPPVEVSAGEIVLFPQNDREHILADRSGVRPISASELIRTAPGRRPLPDRSRRWRRRDADRCADFLRVRTLTIRSSQRCPGVVDRRAQAVGASGRQALLLLPTSCGRAIGLFERPHSALRVVDPGGSSVRIDPCRGQGRLAQGFKDPHIGRALALLIHRSAERALVGGNVGKGGRAVPQRLCRTFFVARLDLLLIRYLTFWRLRSAKLNLRQTGKTVAQLAYSVGYESEEGFSRAFKREFGVSPAQWERDACAGVMRAQSSSKRRIDDCRAYAR